VYNFADVHIYIYIYTYFIYMQYVEMRSHDYSISCQRGPHVSWSVRQRAVVRYLCRPQRGGAEPAAYPGSQAVGAEGHGDPGEAAGAETQPAEGHPTQGAAGETAGVRVGAETTVSCIILSTHTKYNIQEKHVNDNITKMVYAILDGFTILFDM